jgi:predicted dehydrogenase
MGYNWGFVGTGLIAREMGDAFRAKGMRIHSVCGGRPERTRAFAEEYGAGRVCGDLDEMLADGAVDIVYIATPHSSHHGIMKRALEAGRHVLCEKAVTVNARQLEECVAIAETKGLVISDGCTLLHMPLYGELLKLLGGGGLGKVKMIQASFGSLREEADDSRYFSRELAGGALLDIGVYAVAFARVFMRSAPTVALATVGYYRTGVDESSGIVLKNPDGEMAVISLTMRAKQPKRGTVACENGYIEVSDYPRADAATVTYSEGGRVETVRAGEAARAMEYEIEDMERYVSSGSGGVNLRLVRDVMATLSAVRDAWGMTYPCE